MERFIVHRESSRYWNVLERDLGAGYYVTVANTESRASAEKVAKAMNEAHPPQVNPAQIRGAGVSTTEDRGTLQNDQYFGPYGVGTQYGE